MDELTLHCSMRPEDELRIDGAFDGEQDIAMQTTGASLVYLNRTAVDQLIDHLLELVDRPMTKLARATDKARRKAEAEAEAEAEK